MCAVAASAEMVSNGERANPPQSQALRPQLHVRDPSGSVVCRSPRSHAHSGIFEKGERARARERELIRNDTP
jgi:hypothetical protein